MKLIIKQILFSILFLTISLGGCGDFKGNYEEVETDYNNLIIEAEQSNYIKAEEISLLKSWRVSPSEWQPN